MIKIKNTAKVAMGLFASGSVTIMTRIACNGLDCGILNDNTVRNVMGVGSAVLVIASFASLMLGTKWQHDDNCCGLSVQSMFYSEETAQAAAASETDPLNSNLLLVA